MGWDGMGCDVLGVGELGEGELGEGANEPWLLERLCSLGPRLRLLLLLFLILRESCRRSPSSWLLPLVVPERMFWAR